MAVSLECPDVEVGDQSITIRLPGGPTLSVQAPQTNPDGFQVAKNMMGQANSALAPLAPVFNIIDAILAIKGFVDAIPDALGPPPDPSVLVEAIEKVVQKVDKLLALVPQLSVPLLVVDTIDTIIVGLNGIVAQLEAVVAQDARIQAALASSTTPGNEALATIAACAQELNDAQQQAIAAGAAPINRLILVLNIFLELIGLDPIPPLDDLPPDASNAVEALSSVVDALTAIRDSIPIP